MVLFDWDSNIFGEKNVLNSGHFVLPGMPKGSGHTLLGPQYKNNATGIYLLCNICLKEL
jgi:hypothetical protein